jgi:ribosomal protein L40E
MESGKTVKIFESMTGFCVAPMIMCIIIIPLDIVYAIILGGSYSLTTLSTTTTWGIIRFFFALSALICAGVGKDKSGLKPQIGVGAGIPGMIFGGTLLGITFAQNFSGIITFFGLLRYSIPSDYTARTLWTLFLIREIAVLVIIGLMIPAVIAAIMAIASGAKSVAPPPKAPKAPKMPKAPKVEKVPVSPLPETTSQPTLDFATLSPSPSAPAPAAAAPAASAPAEGTAFCLECGSSNAAGARFCEKCGHPLQ